MHFCISENQVICGTCIHDWKKPVLEQCQTRASAHRYLGQTGISQASHDE
jgi:hypothetical protein